MKNGRAALPQRRLGDGGRVNGEMEHSSGPMRI
jgi:hypothetical protein